MDDGRQGLQNFHFSQKNYMKKNDLLLQLFGIDHFHLLQLFTSRRRLSVGPVVKSKNLISFENSVPDVPYQQKYKRLPRNNINKSWIHQIYNAWFYCSWVSVNTETACLDGLITCSRFLEASWQYLENILWTSNPQQIYPWVKEHFYC